MLSTADVPFLRFPKSPRDWIDRLALLSEAEELDHGAREEAENGLLDLFLDSREGRALPDVAPCSVFLDLAGFHLGVTLATLQPRDLGEALFELVPSKVDLGPRTPAPSWKRFVRCSPS